MNAELRCQILQRQIESEKRFAQIAEGLNERLDALLSGFAEFCISAPDQYSIGATQEEVCDALLA